MSQNLLEFAQLAIVPTVLIPFTFLSVGISIAATAIAGLFGIKLKAEGPRKLLEVLLKPRILISGAILNLAILGFMKGMTYWKTRSALIWTIEKEAEVNPALSRADIYSDFIDRPNNFVTLSTVAGKTRGASTKKASTAFLPLQQMWEKKFPQGAFREAAVSSGSLFFGLDDAYAYEINSETGDTVRKFFVGTEVSPTPLVWNNHLYLGEGTHATHHARIYKYSLKDGSLAGAYQTLGHTEGEPQIGTWEGTSLLFAVSGSDGVHAVNPETMERVWQANDGHIDASVLISDGVVYAGTGREKGDSAKHRSFVVAYEFLTGKTIWKHELPASSWMKPSRVGDQVCFVMGEIYFDSDIGGLNCFHHATGLPGPTYRFLAPVVSHPVVIDQSIVVADLYGKVCRVSIKERKEEWCYDTKSKDKAITSVTYDPARHLIAYPSRMDGLYIFNPDTGALLQQWLPEKAAGHSSWSKTYAGISLTNDAWFTMDSAGVLRKLRF